MNIFLPCSTIAGSVASLDDRRLNKMIVETAQMLSTVLGGKQRDERLYKTTHPHHPCTVWLGKTSDNFLFGVAYGRALIAERVRRGAKKSHKSIAVYNAIEDVGIEFIIEAPDGLLPFVNATTNHKQVFCVHEAYQRELYLKWISADPKFFPTWKLDMPGWLTPMQLGYLIQLQEESRSTRLLLKTRNRPKRS